MPLEVELSDRSLPTSGSASIGPAAERILEEFYQAQLAKHESERARMARSARTPPIHKWNRQEVYLSDDQRRRSLAASRRHLMRHKEWLQGPAKLSEAALREVVAVQHFIELDVEDISLPDAEKRNEESFAGASGNICQQMLLDAPRSAYQISGEDWDFAAQLSSRGLNLEKDQDEVMELQSAFCVRISSALERCLGADAPAALVRVVSTAMSQSGLANVERALDIPQVVVGGGDSDVRYEISTVDDCSWELKMSVHKFGFERAIVYTQPASETSEPDPMPVSCSEKSFTRKACTLRVSTSRATGSVEADVLDLRKELQLVDGRGRLLPGFGPQQRGGACRALGVFCVAVCRRLRPKSARSFGEGSKR